MRTCVGAGHVVLALFVSFQGCGKTAKSSRQAPLSPAGQPAPEITGEDLDGVPFKLSDFRGKIVVLNFWAEW